MLHDSHLFNGAMAQRHNGTRAQRVRKGDRGPERSKRSGDSATAERGEWEIKLCVTPC